MNEESERQQPVDRVLTDIHKLLESRLTSGQKRGSTFRDLLNSPVIAAAIVAGFVNWEVAKYQDKAAKIQRAEARRIELNDRKQKVFVEFADNFCVSLILAQGFKLREAWWRGQRDSGQTTNFFAGRTFWETDQDAQKLKSQYMTNKMPDSLCNQVASVFRSTAVLHTVEDLRQDCDRLIESFKTDDISALYEAINNKYKALLREMAAEVREDTL